MISYHLSLCTYLGCVVCAKTNTAIAGISRQFEAHTVQKEYTAILIGNVPDDELCITDKVAGNFPSYKHARYSLYAIIRFSLGLEAESNLKVLKRTKCNVYGTLTTVRLFPKTGRRHQLRYTSPHTNYHTVS
jgi:23S rRNA pseudouridine1911/1915/1917 synthase